MIYEIRNYYFEPTLFAQYREWAKTQAMGYLREHLNVIGFWMNNATPCEIRGVEMDRLGPANITWIIGWADIDQRAETMARVFATPQWNAIFAHVPGGIASYLRMESKFAEAAF